MKNPDKLWADVCNRFAEQSRCKTRKVGCIIVKDDFLIGEGWNSPPRGHASDACVRCDSADYKPGERLELGRCVHAESNAIGHCAKHGRSTVGATIYCTHFCCKYCADLIISAGIKEYVYINEYPGWERVRNQLFLCDVNVRRITG